MSDAIEAIAWILVGVFIGVMFMAGLIETGVLTCN